MYQEISSSELVYFIVPNYSDYPCSNFFVFNERSQCYFSGRFDLLDEYEAISKRFIVISNTEQNNFIYSFKYHTDKELEILFLGAKSFNKRSIDGDLIESDVAKKEILEFIVL